METNNQTDVTGRPPLGEAIAAARAGNRLLARIALERAENSQHDHVDYWLWLAWTADTPASAVLALEHVLGKDPDHELACHGLAWLRGLRDFRLDDTTELNRAEELTEPAAECCSSLDDVSGDGHWNDSSDDGTPQHDVIEDFIAGSVDETRKELDEFLGETCSLDESAETDDEPTNNDDETSADETRGDEPVFHDDSNHDGSYAESKLLDEDDDYFRCDEFDDGKGDEEARSPDDQGPSTSELPPRAQAAATILAVDDSPTIRKLLSMSLEKHGYDVVTACDGIDALNHISSCNPALVLLDINMPRLDGYQLCKLIKNHDKTRMIPVIMLSGKDGMFDKIRGRLAGCNDYITKPFETAELLKKVSSYFPAAVGDA